MSIQGIRCSCLCAQVSVCPFVSWEGSRATLWEIEFYPEAIDELGCWRKWSILLNFMSNEYRGKNMQGTRKDGEKNQTV